MRLMRVVGDRREGDGLRPRGPRPGGGGLADHPRAHPAQRHSPRSSCTRRSASGIIIAAEATLTFLGVGLQLPAISWGLMISAAAGSADYQRPHLLSSPASPLVAACSRSSSGRRATRRAGPEAALTCAPTRAATSTGGTATGPRTLLEVEDLAVEFRTAYGVVNAVNGINYTLDRRARRWRSWASRARARRSAPRRSWASSTRRAGFITTGRCASTRASTCSKLPDGRAAQGPRRQDRDDLPGRAHRR